MSDHITSLKISELFSVKDKVTLITGAGGLGNVLARGFAANDAKVIIASRSLEKMNETIAICREENADCKSYVMDVSDKQQVEDTVSDIVNDFGKIDILLHTSAIAPLGPSLDFNEKDLRRTMDINFIGTVFINAACGRVMAKNGWGRIINISSIDAYTVNCVDDLPYSASKSAMAASTRHFAVDLAKTGVTVNNIAPVWIWTPMMNARPADYMVQAANTIPMGRVSWGEDYLGICFYLASNASTYVTGQTFLVDGGWSVYRAFTYKED
ncbi:SDR family NAD(P)-dependent oxidoreductase [Synergistes jonesii]|uniref:Ketoreductase domain-containing protein n=1 Tax=Synergistes jonesii TaxID=2754 RepID=A0A073IP21_9BACT|nr:SDR family oxidoreductase [Synergistes jonesii]KEJ91330.1 hypothetical protein EH55_10820 [Synergistes jonesii]OFB60398.1 hypothetical protein JS73_11690 [Synergistes jonesii]OFB61223.1 hypothetical protein JS79_11840 [Synergistes jonesii]OFB62894.1 hypothetical protein JS72_07590 [Synergistes jonesii]OFB66609.1 hypothetical protein JS78_11710 [Synergistes jonesii]